MNTMRNNIKIKDEVAPQQSVKNGVRVKLQNERFDTLYDEYTTLEEFHKLMDPLFESLKEIYRTDDCVTFKGI